MPVAVDIPDLDELGVKVTPADDRAWKPMTQAPLQVGRSMRPFDKLFDRRNEAAIGDRVHDNLRCATAHRATVRYHG